MEISLCYLPKSVELYISYETNETQEAQHEDHAIGNNVIEVLVCYGDFLAICFIQKLE